jgi:hypothetical protein
MSTVSKTRAKQLDAQLSVALTSLETYCTEAAETLCEIWDSGAFVQLGFGTFDEYRDARLKTEMSSPDLRSAIVGQLVKLHRPRRNIAEITGTSERQVVRDHQKQLSSQRDKHVTLNESVDASTHIGIGGKSYQLSSKHLETRERPSNRPKTGCSSDGWASGMSLLRGGFNTMMTNPTVGQLLQLEKFLEKALRKTQLRRNALEHNLSVVTE